MPWGEVGTQVVRKWSDLKPGNSVAWKGRSPVMVSLTGTTLVMLQVAPASHLMAWGQ